MSRENAVTLRSLESEVSRESSLLFHVQGVDEIGRLDMA